MKYGYIGARGAWGGSGGHAPIHWLARLRCFWVSFQSASIFLTLNSLVRLFCSWMRRRMSAFSRSMRLSSS